MEYLLATADKIDHGVLTFKATKKDKEGLKYILQNRLGKEPNFSHWVYKNRAGVDHIIIWTHMDLGTMREEVLFLTDYDYNLLDNISPLVIEFSEDENVEEKVEKIAPVTMKSIQTQSDFVPDF